MESLTLEQWKNYFRTTNSNIFDIIKHAIMVAALDCPKEFRLRREHIADKLFTCNFTRCSGCDDARETNGETGGSKESNTNSSGDDPLLHQIGSNYSHGDAEALIDEIEQESMIVGEVLRIKDIFLNTQDEPDSLLFEALRRLQLMALTIDILKATEVGKAVNRLRKHSSMQIRSLAQTLIEGWKELVGEWVTVTEAIAGVFGRYSIFCLGGFWVFGPELHQHRFLSLDSDASCEFFHQPRLIIPGGKS
ncbi:hypothetical protein GQ457_02G024920 [Hibiscus cannabinus]